jgi:hypothetical protein
MKNSLFLIMLIITLLTNACALQDLPIQTSMNTAIPTFIPTGPALPIPTSSSSVVYKKLSIVDRYSIEIPEVFSVHEILSSPSTTDPIYRIEASNNASFDIIVHPYTISSSLIPGKCVVSINFDAGTTSAPIFCEGLELTSLFTTPKGWYVKYGSTITDLSLLCTANTPCPVEVPPDAKYSISYVFVVADKSLDTILEFYIGDAYRGSTNEIDGFEGLGALLGDLIIPSLSFRNP